MSICQRLLLKERGKEHFNTTPSFLCSLQGPYELVSGAEFGLGRLSDAIEQVKLDNYPCDLRLLS